MGRLSGAIHVHCPAGTSGLVVLGPSSSMTPGVRCYQSASVSSRPRNEASPQRTPCPVRFSRSRCAALRAAWHRRKQKVRARCHRWTVPIRPRPRSHPAANTASSGPSRMSLVCDESPRLQEALSFSATGVARRYAALPLEFHPAPLIC